MAFDKKTQGKKTQNSRKKLITQEENSTFRHFFSKTENFIFLKRFISNAYLAHNFDYVLVNESINKKTQEKTQNSRKKLKTQAKNSIFRHFFLNQKITFSLNFVYANVTHNFD